MQFVDDVGDCLIDVLFALSTKVRQTNSFQIKSNQIRLTNRNSMTQNSRSKNKEEKKLV